MQNSLKSIIREAFKIAYNQHTSNLNEDTSEEMAAKFATTPEGQAQKAKADQVINTLENQKTGWDKYHWDPSGTSSVDNLNHAQWNYIIETLSEKARATRDEKYAKIFSNIYSILPTRTVDGDGNSVSSNSPAYNYFLNASEMLRDVARQNPDMAFEALENAWGRAFYTDEWYKLLDLYKSQPGANFGSLLANNIRRWTNDLLKSKKNKLRRGTSSLDAPSNITGKSTDVEGGMEAGEDDSLEDDGQGYNAGSGIPDDEENSADSLETGLDAYAFDANDVDSDAKRKKVAFLKFAKFQKAIDKIITISQTIPLTTQQKQGLLAIKEIGTNFKTYDEIAAEFPNDFSEEDETGKMVSADVASVKSKLKSKILIGAANEILAPYNLTYDIFSDPNWQSTYNLDSTIVDQIIEKFNSVAKAGTSEKRQYTHAFKLFADQHLSPEEIAKIPAQGVYKKDKKASSSGAAVYKAVMNLNRNQKFEAIADSILNEFGFPISFDTISWSDYWKAGKELKGAQKQPVVAKEKDPESNLYPFQRESYEKFLADNLEQIMENVYKRLSKNL